MDFDGFDVDLAMSEMDMESQANMNDAYFGEISFAPDYSDTVALLDMMTHDVPDEVIIFEQPQNKTSYNEGPGEGGPAGWSIPGDMNGNGIWDAGEIGATLFGEGIDIGAISMAVWSTGDLGGVENVYVVLTGNPTTPANDDDGDEIEATERFIEERHVFATGEFPTQVEYDSSTGFYFILVPTS